MKTVYNNCYKHNECVGKPSRLYRIWVNMISRCKYSSHKSFYRYGGRGIIVCDEWKTSSNFFDWAKNNGYQENLELDRINNDGNYEPQNCHWITHQENTLNRNKKKFNGIYFIKKYHNYAVKLRRNGVMHHGGTASTIEDALILRDNLLKMIQNGRIF